MHESFKEIRGFACRWCLLALAGSAVVVGTWTGLRGAGPMATSLRADMRAVDVICSRSEDGSRSENGPRPAYVWLHHTNSPGRQGVSHVFAGYGDGPLMLDWRRDDYASVVPLPCPQEGSFTVCVAGLPYGHLAFRQAWALVDVGPPATPEERVYLVDSRMPTGQDAPGEADRQTWRTCIELLAARGRVAFFHMGVFNEYATVRERLRRTYPDIAVVYLGDSAAAFFEGLYGVVNATNPGMSPGSGRSVPVVIAINRDLPRHGWRWDFPTRVVGPVTSPIVDRDLLDRPEDRFRQYESVEHYVRALRNEVGVGNDGGRQ